MRLFIAINLDETLKSTLFETVQKLKKYSKQGNFTQRENLHLTLVFIGETTKTNLIKKAMNKVSEDKFILSLSTIGRFKRTSGDIYWIGLEEKNKTLISIYNQLYKLLTSEGFKIENREYNPHLTLGRQIILDNSFNKDDFQKTLSKIDMQIRRISLIKSERINGKLIYTEIYNKDLT